MKSIHILSAFILSSVSFHAIAQEARPGEYVVKMRGDPSRQIEVIERLAQKGFQTRRVLRAASGIFLTALDPKLLRTQREIMSLANEDIEYLEPNYIYRTSVGAKPPERLPPPPPAQGVNRAALPTVFPNDPSFGSLWGLYNDGRADSKGTRGVVGADIWAPQAWALHKGSKSVIVAVIDTGVDVNHPDLKDNLWVGENGIRGYNAVKNNFDPFDDDGHGTHCAGTIGGRGSNSLGVTGVNWTVQIMPIKFMEKGAGDLASAIRGIRWAVDHGAQVLSNSWGGGGYSRLLEEEIKNAQSKGVLFVAASGNEGNDNDKKPSYPASYKVDNVISVAATDNRDRLASFSNYGATSVDLSAPGVSVLSTVLNKSYASFDGTSMATPHVAGAAALLMSYRVGLSVPQVKAKILNSVDKVPALNQKVLSGGRLNLYRMLQ